MDSILNSVKTILGIVEDYTPFDAAIIMHINTAFMGLTQLGVGPEAGFSISDKTSTWSDFLEDNTNLEAVKSYVAMKVRLMFDPPTVSSVLESMNRQIAEMEFRLGVNADTSAETGNSLDIRFRINDDGDLAYKLFKT